MSNPQANRQDEHRPQNAAAAADAVLDQAEATVPAAEIESVQAELAAAKNQLLLEKADKENLRKRARRDLEESLRYANLPLLRDLLPVMDNIGRAIQAAQATPDPAALIEGFRLVAQQLENVFSQFQCVRLSALGQPFDPNLHAAISQQPSAELPAHTVLQVVQDGYQVHDRVVRPAQVVVSSGLPHTA